MILKSRRRKKVHENNNFDSPNGMGCKTGNGNGRCTDGLNHNQFLIEIEVCSRRFLPPQREAMELSAREKD